MTQSQPQQQQPQQQQQAIIPTKLYVTNFPFSCTQRQIQELFSRYGQVVECTLKKDYYAYILYSNSKSAQNAFKNANGIRLFGRKLSVHLATSKKSQSHLITMNNTTAQTSANGIASTATNASQNTTSSATLTNSSSNTVPNPIDDTKIIHIRNFPETCTQQQIKDYFVQYGDIVECLILHDSYAFVHYKTASDARLALQSTNNTQFMSCNLLVQYSRSKFKQTVNGVNQQQQSNSTQSGADYSTRNMRNNKFNHTNSRRKQDDDENEYDENEYNNGDDDYEPNDDYNENGDDELNGDSHYDENDADDDQNDEENDEMNDGYRHHHHHHHHHNHVNGSVGLYESAGTNGGSHFHHHHHYHHDNKLLNNQHSTNVNESTQIQCRTKLYVTNFPEDMDQEEMRKLFNQYGDVLECTIMWNQYAFVHFGSYGEAEKALNGIKGITYKGCKISVQWSTSSKYQQPKAKQNNYENKLSSNNTTTSNTTTTAALPTNDEKSPMSSSSTTAISSLKSTTTATTANTVPIVSTLNSINSSTIATSTQTPTANSKTQSNEASNKAASQATPFKISFSEIVRSSGSSTTTTTTTSSGSTATSSIALSTTTSSHSVTSGANSNSSLVVNNHGSNTNILTRTEPSLEGINVKNSMDHASIKVLPNTTNLKTSPNSSQSTVNVIGSNKATVAKITPMMKANSTTTTPAQPATTNSAKQIIKKQQVVKPSGEELKNDMDNEVKLSQKVNDLKATESNEPLANGLQNGMNSSATAMMANITSTNLTIQPPMPIQSQIAPIGAIGNRSAQTSDNSYQRLASSNSNPVINLQHQTALNNNANGNGNKVNFINTNVSNVNANFNRVPPVQAFQSVNLPQQQPQQPQQQQQQQQQAPQTQPAQFNQKPLINNHSSIEAYNTNNQTPGNNQMIEMYNGNMATTHHFDGNNMHAYHQHHTIMHHQQLPANPTPNSNSQPPLLPNPPQNIYHHMAPPPPPPQTVNHQMHHQMQQHPHMNPYNQQPAYSTSIAPMHHHQTSNAPHPAQLANKQLWNNDMHSNQMCPPPGVNPNTNGNTNGMSEYDVYHNSFATSGMQQLNSRYPANFHNPFSNQVNVPLSGSNGGSNPAMPPYNHHPGHMPHSTVSQMHPHHHHPQSALHPHQMYSNTIGMDNGLAFIRDQQQQQQQQQPQSNQMSVPPGAQVHGQVPVQFELAKSFGLIDQQSATATASTMATGTPNEFLLMQPSPSSSSSSNSTSFLTNAFANITVSSSSTSSSSSSSSSNNANNLINTNAGIQSNSSTPTVVTSATLTGSKSITPIQNGQSSMFTTNDSLAAAYHSYNNYVLFPSDNFDLTLQEQQPQSFYPIEDVLANLIR